MIFEVAKLKMFLDLSSFCKLMKNVKRTIFNVSPLKQRALPRQPSTRNLGILMDETADAKDDAY